MDISVDAVLIDSVNPEKIVDFYRAIGVPIEEEHHGPELHWGCMLNGLHFAVHKVKNTGNGHSISISFAVSDVDEMIVSLKKKGTKVTMDPCDKPFGRLASVLDPDGNTVYLHKY
jgi:predicted enzyme related to lactoylglutathione lyase